MYFPNAFRKSFLVSSGTLASANGTKDLTAGQLGFFSPTSTANSTLQIATAGVTPFYAVQGSYFSSDKIGAHGGYKESIKSKLINPKYISRIIKVSAKAPANHVMKVSVNNLIPTDTTYRLRLDVKGSPALRFLNHQLYKTLDSYTGCANATNPSYNRDPVLTLLSWKDQVNNSPILKDMVIARVYKYAGTQSATGTVTFQSLSQATIPMSNTTGAVIGQKAVGAGIPANSFITTVTPASSIVIKYPVQNANPTISSSVAVQFFTDVYSADNLTAAAATFIPGTTTLTNGTPSAYTADSDNTSITYTQNPHIEFTMAFVETSFLTCTFSPTDKYELEPLVGYASIVDESGNPCLTTNFVANTAAVAANNPYLSSHGIEVQAPVQASGLGETVLREFILDGRYLQNAYPDSSRVDSLRMREIEADPALSQISRSAYYDKVIVLHNVPRWNNPNGTFDNDQYMLVFNVAAGTSTTAITNFFISSANAAQGTGTFAAVESY